MDDRQAGSTAESEDVSANQQGESHQDDKGKEVGGTIEGSNDGASSRVLDDHQAGSTAESEDIEAEGKGCTSPKLIEGHQPGNTSESDGIEDLSAANQQTESHRDDDGKGKVDNPNDGDGQSKLLLHGVKLNLDLGSTELTYLTI
jgi:hypothetical protein